MRKHSAWIFELLLRVLQPARGRHRSAGTVPALRWMDTPTLVLPRVPVRPQGLLRGEDVHLIRPYALTPEERRERRGRRRALRLTVHGYDAGPPWIHGVEVTAG